ncbi:MAG: hypothetical protein LIP12_10080 [Clostridiales bacterium]|nr:hypothetical protein [Clostridiales bacterium]
MDINTRNRIDDYIEKLESIMIELDQLAEEESDNKDTFEDFAEEFEPTIYDQLDENHDNLVDAVSSLGDAVDLLREIKITI